MDILILLKQDDRDQYLIDFIDKFKPEETTVTYLNVVQVSGDIPLKLSGEVLDNCTEFDLNHYQNRAAKNQAYFLKQLNGQNVEVRIGDFERILLYELQEKKYQLLVTGAHLSHEFEDVFQTNLNSHIINKVKIPYLTLKCDNAQNSLEKVLFLGTFSSLSQKANILLEHLKDLDSAQMFFAAVGEEAHINTWSFYQKHQHHFKQIEINAHALEEEIIKHNPDLIILGEMPDDQSFWSKKHNKISLVNHLAKPILII